MWSHGSSVKSNSWSLERGAKTGVSFIKNFEINANTEFESTSRTKSGTLTDFRQNEAQSGVPIL